MRPLLLAMLLILLTACGAEGETSATPTAAAVDGADEADEADESVAAATATEDPKDLPVVTLPGVPPVGEEDPSAQPDPLEPPGPEVPPTEGLPGGRYVRIDAIGLDEAAGGSYQVTFEPFSFVPLIGSGPDDFHVHFFFDTVAPENAGTNGQPPGEWFLYDGPSPFTGYTVADRPDGATQMCALVADAAHAITVGTGNCVPLP